MLHDGGRSVSDRTTSLEPPRSDLRTNDEPVALVGAGQGSTPFSGGSRLRRPLQGFSIRHGQRAYQEPKL